MPDSSPYAVNLFVFFSAFILLPVSAAMNQKMPAPLDSQRDFDARAHLLSNRRDHYSGVLVHGEEFSRSTANAHENRSGRLAVALATAILAVFAGAPVASAHDGKLDAYGCHYTEDRKDYHCHEGTFKGARFNSKIEMIRQLKLQFLNLGKPWPHDDIAEEDITSTEEKPGK